MHTVSLRASTAARARTQGRQEDTQECTQDTHEDTQDARDSTRPRPRSARTSASASAAALCLCAVAIAGVFLLSAQAPLLRRAALPPQQQQQQQQPRHSPQHQARQAAAGAAGAAGAAVVAAATPAAGRVRAVTAGTPAPPPPRPTGLSRYPPAAVPERAPDVDDGRDGEGEGVGRVPACAAARNMRLRARVDALFREGHLVVDKAALADVAGTCATDAWARAVWLEDEGAPAHSAADARAVRACLSDLALLFVGDTHARELALEVVFGLFEAPRGDIRTPAGGADSSTVVLHDFDEGAHVWRTVAPCRGLHADGHERARVAAARAAAWSAAGAVGVGGGRALLAAKVRALESSAAASPACERNDSACIQKAPSAETEKKEKEKEKPAEEKDRRNCQDAAEIDLAACGFPANITVASASGARLTHQTMSLWESPALQEHVVAWAHAHVHEIDAVLINLGPSALAKPSVEIGVLGFAAPRTELEQAAFFVENLLDRLPPELPVLWFDFHGLAFREEFRRANVVPLDPLGSLGFAAVRAGIRDAFPDNTAVQNVLNAQEGSGPFLAAAMSGLYSVFCEFRAELGTRACAKAGGAAAA